MAIIVFAGSSAVGRGSCNVDAGCLVRMMGVEEERQRERMGPSCIEGAKTIDKRKRRTRVSATLETLQHDVAVEEARLRPLSGPCL